MIRALKSLLRGGYNEHIIADAVDHWEKDCNKAFKVTEYLVSKGIKIKNAYYKSNQNLLHKVATMKGDNCGDFAKYLIVNGADYMVNQLRTFPGTGMNAKSPFYMALNIKNYPVAKVIAEHGLKPNAPIESSRKNITPLEMTVYKGNVEIAKILIKNGANNIEAAKRIKVRSSTVQEYLIVEH